jgi:hypothetical protein
VASLTSAYSGNDKDQFRTARSESLRTVAFLPCVGELAAGSWIGFSATAENGGEAFAGRIKLVRNNARGAGLVTARSGKESFTLRSARRAKR